MPRFQINLHEDEHTDGFEDKDNDEQVSNDESPVNAPQNWITSLRQRRKPIQSYHSSYDSQPNFANNGNKFTNNENTRNERHHPPQYTHTSSDDFLNSNHYNNMFGQQQYYQQQQQSAGQQFINSNVSARNNHMDENDDFYNLGFVRRHDSLGNMNNCNDNIQAAGYDTSPVHYKSRKQRYNSAFCCCFICYNRYTWIALVALLAWGTICGPSSPPPSIYDDNAIRINVFGNKNHADQDLSQTIDKSWNMYLANNILHLALVSFNLFQVPCYLMHSLLVSTYNKFQIIIETKYDETHSACSYQLVNAHSVNTHHNQRYYSRPETNSQHETYTSLSTTLGIFGQDFAVEQVANELLTWTLETPRIILLAGLESSGKRTTALRAMQYFYCCNVANLHQQHQKQKCNSEIQPQFEQTILSLYGSDYNINHSNDNKLVLANDQQLALLHTDLFTRIDNHVRNFQDGSTIIIERIEDMNPVILHALLDSFQITSVWDWGSKVVLFVLTEQFGVSAIKQSLRLTRGDKNTAAQLSSVPLIIGQDLDRFIGRSSISDKLDALVGFFPIQKPDLISLLFHNLQNELEIGVVKGQWHDFHIERKAVEVLVEQKQELFASLEMIDEETNNKVEFEFSVSGAKPVGRKSSIIASILLQLRKCAAVQTNSNWFLLIQTSDDNQVSVSWCISPDNCQTECNLTV